jgi:hypothetical protein
MSCPLCNQTMKGRTLCAAHEKQVSDRSASYNVPRSDAMDQLWQMRAEELADERAEALEIAGDL